MGNKNKLPNAFDTDQLVKLFDAIDRPKVGMACALAFFCGLRISEVCNLRIEDIDFGAKKLKVVNGKYTLRATTGYGKDRYVEIPDQMMNPLKKWVEIIDGGKWLFPSDKSPDSHLRKKSLYEQYRFFLKRAGLELAEQELEYSSMIKGKVVKRCIVRHKYNFHTLRHSYGTYLRNKGVPIEDIKDLMGHERFDTTLVYAKIASHRRREVVNQAFNAQLRQTVIPQQEIRQMAPPSPRQTPMQYLQMQFLRGEISKDEYRERLSLLKEAGSIAVEQPRNLIEQSVSYV